MLKFLDKCMTKTACLAEKTASATLDGNILTTIFIRDSEIGKKIAGTVIVVPAVYFGTKKIIEIAKDKR